jgi:predicted PurR-regulated permease PerM
MPKQGLAGVTELLGDLYRELSPIVRACVFTGIGLGLLATVGWLVFGPSTGILIIPTSLGALGFLVFVFCLPAFAGGILGCLVGVLIEVVFGKGDSPGGRGKPTRRK